MLVGTLTPAYLREQYLRGLTLGAAWDGAAGDAAMTGILQAIIEDVQYRLGIRFARQRILTYPDVDKVLGTDYEIQGEPLMYKPIVPGSVHYIIPLPFSHIQSIERVRLFVGNPGPSPESKALWRVPDEWILFTQKEGVLRLMAGLTTGLLQTMALGRFDPLYYGAYYRTAIPGAWAVDYTIGYGQIPLDVARWICLTAAVQILAEAGSGADVGAGRSSTSLSMDGISESIAYVSGDFGPYSGVIKAYQDELKCMDIRQLRLRHKGIKIGIW